MIKLNKIEPQTVEVFDPQNNSLGFLNEYEFLDLRAQIAEQRVEGYYYMFNEDQIFIDKDGRSWQPNKLFNSIENSLVRIMTANFSKK
jgi:hypothetical protein